MTTSPNTPGWAQAFMVRLAPVGVRTVVRRAEKVYRYRYLRLDVRAFPEITRARRIRLAIVPPDFSAAPVMVTARLVKRGLYVQGFTIDAAYQQVVTQYIRNDYVGVLFIETIEFEKEVGTPRL
jgi:hypothetical protein